MNEELLQDLISKYLSGTASPEEEQLLESWYNSGIPDDIVVPFDSEEEKNGIMAGMRARLLAYVYQQEHAVSKKKNVRTIAVAASVIILLGISYLFYQNTFLFHKSGKDLTTKKKEILPGHYGATLTLSDGKKYMLDSVANGVLTSQAGAYITKQGGQIVYNKTTDKSIAVAHNTLTVPKAREFRIVLPDGTHVWLNSASSLKFPTAFTAKERVVELDGEAYFEVVHNARHPFRVKVKNTVIEDIGTAFNVNAYGHSVKTTLISGSVNVSNHKVCRVLNPGQQVVAAADLLTVAPIDTSHVLAWKDGFFQFDDADIQTIMQQLARWYDIEIVFAGEMPPKKFYGRINRNMKLSDVLKILEQSNVHFDLEGENKLIVKP